MHLSGLRLGARGTNWRWPSVRESMRRDLEKVHARVGRFEFLFVTGDLTLHGTAEEFAEVDWVLESLYEVFVSLGSEPRLIAVPGERDVLAATDLYEAEWVALRTWHADSGLRGHVLGASGGRYVRRLEAAFEPYTAWATGGRWPGAGGTVGLLPGDRAAAWSVGGTKVGVVGLNSVFLRAAGEVALDVDPRQLHAVCGGDAPAWLGQHPVNLLLTSHAATQLEGRSRDEFHAEITAPGRFAAHLVGRGDGAATLTRTGGALRLVVPGVPLFDAQGMTRDGRSFGYDAMRIEVGARAVRVHHFPRRMFGAVDLRFGAAVEVDEGDGAEVYEVPRVRRGW